MRVLAVVLCVCMAFFLLPIGVLGAEAGKLEFCTVSLSYGGENDGVFEVVFEAAAENGICGVLGAVSYDAERLILLTAGAECGGAMFSFLDIGGEVRFLMDGAQNFGGAVSVSLFFGMAEGDCGAARVSVALVEAFCLSGGAITNLKVKELNGVVELGKEGKAEGKLALLAWKLRENGAETVLSVLGLVEGEYFAVGVELFVVYDDGSGDKILVAGVMPLSGDETFELSVRIDNAEVCAFIITPVAFDRVGRVRGEKAVVVN